MAEVSEHVSLNRVEGKTFSLYLSGTHTVGARMVVRYPYSVATCCCHGKQLKNATDALAFRHPEIDAVMSTLVSALKQM